MANKISPPKQFTADINEDTFCFFFNWKIITEESSRSRSSIFYSLSVSPLFPQHSVQISSVLFTICQIGGRRMVRCSPGRAEPSVGSRPAWEAPEPDRATRILPGQPQPPDPHQRGLKGTMQLPVQPFCFGFKMLFFPQTNVNNNRVQKLQCF